MRKSWEVATQIINQNKWANKARVMGWRKNRTSTCRQFRENQATPAKVSSHMSGSEGKSVAKPPGSATSVESGIHPIIRKKIFLTSTRANQTTANPAGRNVNQFISYHNPAKITSRLSTTNAATSRPCGWPFGTPISVSSFKR